MLIIQRSAEHRRRQRKNRHSAITTVARKITRCRRTI